MFGAGGGFGFPNSGSSGGQDGLSANPAPGSTPLPNSLTELYATIYSQFGRGIEQQRQQQPAGADASSGLHKLAGSSEQAGSLQSHSSILSHLKLSNSDLARAGQDAGLLESLKEAGIKMDGNNSDDYYKQLEVKVQRRLLQNREAARRCREKRQAYVKQLEDQLEILKKQRKQQLEELASFEVGLAAGGMESRSSAVLQNLQEAEDRIGFYKAWQDKYMAAAKELRQLLVTSGVSDDQLRVLYETCRTTVTHYIVAKRQAVEAGHVLAVMVGGFFAPRERLLCWLGGFRPSDLLTAIQELARLAAVPVNQLEPFLRVKGQVAVEEAQLLAAYSGARRGLLEAAVTGGGPGQGSALAGADVAQEGAGGQGGGGLGQGGGLQGAMGAMGQVLLQVDSLLSRMFAEMGEHLTPKQMACAMVSMYELLRQMQRLSDAMASSPPDTLAAPGNLVS